METRLNEWLNKLLDTQNVDRVIAVDTDSVYLSLGDLLDKTIRDKNPTKERIVDFIDKICREKITPFNQKVSEELAVYLNAHENKLDMKREAIFDKAIWTAKKRYIVNIWDNEGVRYKVPEIKVMGLEVKKSSTPSSCRKKLTEAIEIIMNKSEDDIISFISEFREEFQTLPPGDIAFPRGVNGISKYMKDPNHTPIHVRGSILYNKLLSDKHLTKDYPFIKEGEKIKFLYLKLPNPIQSNIIAFHNSIPKELDLMDWIDYTTQYDKSFVEPLKIILDSIGWKTEKVNTLARFLRKGKNDGK